MALNSADIVDDLAGHAEALGYFDRVLQHEPKSAPSRGMTAAVWLDTIQPAESKSGLISTTARLTFTMRIYLSMLQDPQDGIDRQLLEASDKLFESLAGDFTLSGDAAYIDLLGAAQGHPLQGESGYINIDNKVFRVFTIVVPVIVNDAWPQAE